MTQAFVDGMVAAARRKNVAFSAQAVGGMFGLYFSPEVPTSYRAVMSADHPDKTPPANVKRK